MVQAHNREERDHGDEFTSEQWRQVDEIVASHRGGPGALIPVLEQVQAVTGYLPACVQKHVARGLGVPLGRVYGVVTFYSLFTMKPRGRHQIRVCLGTACHVRGSQKIMDDIRHELGVEPGDCTADRSFSLDTVRCVGACGLAPVVVVDEDTHRQVKAAKVREILDTYRVADAETEG